ncbi:MAG: hypothetical protein EZS28_019117 [Streblomastix strix]|uniref:Uncharacterized protein n=1 Tax=Streblomastix strix TaxID=222440 RepID=A0A5J4VT18_9EUKA|nr:MAG: hypothetical protein EZS28_019117 [Streblomastix strix]
MSSIIGSSFIKSDADDSVVLLGAGKTKSVSEFSNSVDDSNYIKKVGDIQDISEILRKIALDQPYSEPTDDDYTTLGAVKKANSKDDTSILFAGGGDLLLSDFSCGGATVEILTSQVAINETATSTPKQEGFAPSTNIKIRTLPTQYTPIVSELCIPVDGPYGGFKPHIANTGEIRCYTVGASWIEQISFSDAAGLSDFPELYAYIKEHYPKPIGELLQPVPIGDQILQQQSKNNDDIIYGSGEPSADPEGTGSNEEFELPVPNAIKKLDLSSLQERNSFLASSGSDPQLFVYGDRITLTASYASTGLFPGGCQLCGYLFKSYPQEARPKMCYQVIALVGTEASNKYNTF